MTVKVYKVLIDGKFEGLKFPKTKTEVNSKKSSTIAITRKCKFPDNIRSDLSTRKENKEVN